MLDHIGGTFNTVIVSEEGDVPLLASDRTGSQPIAYSTVGGGIVFGPDFATLLAHPLVDDAILPQAIFDYIYFHFVPLYYCARLAKNYGFDTLLGGGRR